MGGKSDQAKGRAKEATGILTGNDDLESEARPTSASVRPRPGSTTWQTVSRTPWTGSRPAMVFRLAGPR